MKSGKLLAAGAVVVIVAVGAFFIHGIYSHNNKKQPVINETILANAGTYNTAPCNNDKVTQNMSVTTQVIDLANGVSIPKGTYEAPIPGPNGDMLTDYLVTGLVIPLGTEPINEYSNIYGNQVIATVTPGQILATGPTKGFIGVTGYVNGYYVSETTSGQTAFVKATDVKLDNNIASLLSMDLGNMPYAVDLVQDPQLNQTLNVYQYPTALSKVVGEIGPSNISGNIAANKMTVLNTANKMLDIEYNGVQGWILSSQASAHLKQDSIA